ncbi:MAG: hypothetical protein IIB55_08755 [Planctomycetes bacterium]|nr:hypothetical protein [Planctomycetota bacterium]
MNCSVCDELLIRKALEPLGEDETARLDRHLEACAACRQRAAGDAALLAALDALREDIHAAETTFVFRPSQALTTARSARSVVMPLMRAGVAMAAVWAMVVLVGHRDPGSPGDRGIPGIVARPLTAQRAERPERFPVIRTASVAPWLGMRSGAHTTRLRGRVRLAVPAYMPCSNLSAMKTPSILIRPRRKDNVDRDQDSRGFGGGQPVGAGPRNRRDARI